MNKYDVAANVALAGLDEWTGRLSGAQQRSLFGLYIFGRKTITIDCSGQGRVYGQYSCAYGQDGAFFDKSFERIAQYANNPETIQITF